MERQQHRDLQRFLRQRVGQQPVGYFKRVDDATHYRVNVGTSEQHGSVDGYLSHDGSLAKVDLSANYHEGEYRSAGIALQGGATLTAHGGAAPYPEYGRHAPAD